MDSDGYAGWDTSIAIDSADHPHISYNDWSNGDLKYAFRTAAQDDIAIFRNGWWWVSKPDHSGTAYKFKYGISGDKPVVGDIG